MKTSVTLYTTLLCPVCKTTKDFLDMCEIPYHEVQVDINPIERLKLITKTGKLSVPQTNINGTWISGFDPTKTLQALNDHPGT